MNTSTLEHVSGYVAREKLTSPGERVLVGVSGGCDSVVLLHVLKELGYPLLAAHVNFQLRGEESDEDEWFVRALCREWDVPTRSLRADARQAATERALSLEDAAREIRYRFFLETAAEAGIHTVAVAHHQDDQIETVLLQLFRGSGPEGLGGMHPRRRLAPGSNVHLVRPLLETTRAEIRAYAEQHRLSWREDVTNQDVSYRRNAIRHVILRDIETHFGPGALSGIVQSARLMQQYQEETFAPELAARFAACCAPGVRALLVAELKAQPVVWQHRILIEAARRYWGLARAGRSLGTRLSALLDAQTGRRVESTAGTAWRDRRHIVFEAAVPPVPFDAGVLSHGDSARTPAGTISFELLDAPPEGLDAGTPDVAYLDADRLTLPLCVRAWQPGDRLRPLGMKGTKKVSDLLTDAHVPPAARRTVPVVLSGADIVWVPGVRLAHPFRVTPKTRHIAKILFIRAPEESLTDALP